MERYEPKKIEAKWQHVWAERGIYRAADDKEKKKCYVLDMFPYPSGEGLHVGHLKGYIATDIYSRYQRLRGFNVLHPMGWDAFGLPAENFALKHKIHPRGAVGKNIARYKEQLALIGFDYDWSREVNTTDPEFYKWTQWIFLKLFEKGLAYESMAPINWCPSCQTGLANEDVEGGRCERCGTAVEKKPMRQWLLKITDYADRLLEDLDKLDWPEAVKESQRNWIGKREGAVIRFQVIGGKEQKIEVFTTRPETIFGATYLALAPEHPEISKFKAQSANKSEIEKYLNEVKNKTEIERADIKKIKTGVELKGVKAINPANNEEIPIWVTDYVLPDYGTGAIMAVPAHDERDRAFAEKYGLPVSGAPLAPVEKILPTVGGQKRVIYKLRDWVFSRQRYWGEPIPIIHCGKCGVVPVPEKDLPVTLPEVARYEPTGTGESPLARIAEWVNTVCPKCGGRALRETNTMPQWAGSSWYYIAYVLSAKLKTKSAKLFWNKKIIKYWLPVDRYVGGAEHATRHLIYARFWHKFLFDLGVVATDEPFRRYKNQGLIAGADGRKMSKRYGNVVNPDEVIAAYGADTFRLYEMFMGPFNEGAAWNPENIIGSRRFLEQVWQTGFRFLDADAEERETAPPLRLSLDRTIAKLTADIEDFKFNTAVSALMIFLNEVRAARPEAGLSQGDFLIFLRLLAPFAPHLTEELWSRRGGAGSIHLSRWPEPELAASKPVSVTIVIQVNGRVRDQVELPTGASEEQALAAALARPTIQRFLGAHPPTRVVYVPDRLLNLVAPK